MGRRIGCAPAASEGLVDAYKGEVLVADGVGEGYLGVEVAAHLHQRPLLHPGTLTSDPIKRYQPDI